MGVPSTRTPIQIARGTYSSLSTTNALAALEEGEIAFASDQGKLFVKQGSSLTGVSGTSSAAFNVSFSSSSPAISSGTGTSADPYVLATGECFLIGGTINSTETITVTGTPGDVILFTGNFGTADRFSYQSAAIIGPDGKYTFNLVYKDQGSSFGSDTQYTGDLQLGQLHFRWNVSQRNTTPLTKLTDSTIAESTAGTYTCTPGTVSGAASPYTSTIRWQRSVDGSTGWVNTVYTGTTYEYRAEDNGYYLRALVTFSDSTSSGSGGPHTIELPSASSGVITSSTSGSWETGYTPNSTLDTSTHINYRTDTSSGAHYMQLPDSNSQNVQVGDSVTFVDGNGTWNTNNFTVKVSTTPSADRIMGVAADLVCNVQYATVTLTWSGVSTVGWLVN